jgi:prepilin-type N-terminal cleavage/methylation domain-containing protein
MFGRGKTGFTSIELLIVIAIILILIAIALPNFLEAQIRAKVARVRADQRTIATALESYSLDNHGDYPPYRQWGTHGMPAYFNALTSPIKYITDVDAVSDPFFDAEIDELGYDRYGYYSDGLVRGARFQSSDAWRSIWGSMIRQQLPGIWAFAIASPPPAPIRISTSRVPL